MLPAVQDPCYCRLRRAQPPSNLRLRALRRGPGANQRLDHGKFLLGEVPVSLPQYQPRFSDGTLACMIHLPGMERMMSLSYNVGQLMTATAGAKQTTR